MEHRLPVGADEREKYDTKAYFKLACDMQIFYAMKQNRKRHGISPEGVLVDDLCVIEAEETYERYIVFIGKSEIFLFTGSLNSDA